MLIGDRELSCFVCCLDALHFGFVLLICLFNLSVMIALRTLDCIAHDGHHSLFDGPVSK